jgi:hypothetical protein
MPIRSAAMGATALVATALGAAARRAWESVIKASFKPSI